MRRRTPVNKIDGASIIKLTIAIITLLGLALGVYLVYDAGLETVVQAMALIGWGLIPVTLFHLIPMSFSTLSWREMLPPMRRPNFLSLTWIRWIRTSINNLLPVGQVGGDLVCIRLVHLRGVPGATATASMMADLTVGVFTQLAFVVLGLAVLLSHSTEPAVLAVVWSVLIGLGVFLVFVIVFFLLQRKGLFTLIVKTAGALSRSEKVLRIAGTAEQVDVAIRQVYNDRDRLWKAIGWRMASWILGTGEIWLLAYFLGQELTFSEALIIESLGVGVKAAAFFIPGAIGVLEGSFIVFGSLFGLSAGDALAIALGKRVRELAMGLPGLIAWQVEEGRRFL